MVTQGQIQGVHREQEVHPSPQLIPQYISKSFLTAAFAEFNTCTKILVICPVADLGGAGGHIPSTLPQLLKLAVKHQALIE